MLQLFGAKNCLLGVSFATSFRTSLLNPGSASTLFSAVYQDSPIEKKLKIEIRK